MAQGEVYEGGEVVFSVGYKRSSGFRVGEGFGKRERKESRRCTQMDADGEREFLVMEKFRVTYSVFQVGDVLERGRGRRAADGRRWGVFMRVFLGFSVYHHDEEQSDVMICSPRYNLPHFSKVYSAVTGKRQITLGTLQLLIEQVADRIEMSHAALAMTILEPEKKPLTPRWDIRKLLDKIFRLLRGMGAKRGIGDILKK
jgi:hypothetical protein